MPSRSVIVLLAVRGSPWVGLPATVTFPMGWSLTSVILTVVVPVAVMGPPEPCTPVVLPSLKVHRICTEVGGACELLL